MAPAGRRLGARAVGFPGPWSLRRDLSSNPHRRAYSSPMHAAPASALARDRTLSSLPLAQGDAGGGEERADQQGRGSGDQGGTVRRRPGRPRRGAVPRQPQAPAGERGELVVEDGVGDRGGREQQGERDRQQGQGQGREGPVAGEGGSGGGVHRARVGAAVRIRRQVAADVS